ncbi:MAG TPA: type IV pilin [Thermoplasmata archaeon]|nr:type IV pilin [Thermoplasmata archaeon]
MKTVRRPPSDAVSPIVAEILLVAVTVVLAAVLYLMASGLLTSRATIPPVVAFSSVQPFPSGTYNATFSVADASRAVTIPNFHFVLKVGATFGPASDFAASGVPVPVSVNGTVYRVTWLDVNGGGTLAAGDTITVSGNGVSLPRSTSFDFFLLWTDGSQLTHEAWTTP